MLGESFARCITDTGICAQILLPLRAFHNSLKWKDQKWDRKRGKETDNSPPPKVIKMVLKHMKRCSTLPIIREMQIKTAPRYHFSPTRLAKIKKPNNTLCWRACKEADPATRCRGDAYRYSIVRDTGMSRKALCVSHLTLRCYFEEFVPNTYAQQYENTRARDR